MGIKKIVIKDNDTGKNTKNRMVAQVYDDDGKCKNVYFGMEGSGGTYYDGATPEKKDNYIDRHARSGENWTSSGARTAGFYSRWALWESRSKAEIKKVIKEKTGAKTVNTSGMTKIRVTKPN